MLLIIKGTRQDAEAEAKKRELETFRFDKETKRGEVIAYVLSRTDKDKAVDWFNEELPSGVSLRDLTKAIRQPLPPGTLLFYR